MKRCKKCGRELRAGDRFCLGCGRAVAAESSDGPRDAIAQRKPQAAATPTGPLPFVMGRFKAAFKELRTMLKTPSRLLPTLILAAIWLVLTMLPFFGIEWMPLRALSFITFARGGMFGGLLGAIGGIGGKAVTAYVLNAVLLPLIKGKRPFKGSLGKLMGSMAGQGFRAVSPLLTGAGFALVVYNLMNFTGNMQNAMISLIALVAALQALGKRGGFLFGLLFSFAGRLSKSRMPSYQSVDRAIGGMALGFGIALVLTAVPLRWLCFIVGIALLLAGLLAGKLFSMAQSATDSQRREGVG